MKHRFLCVCEGGNCRSVSLAYVLKDFFGQDALACGVRGNSPETLEHLCGAWDPKYIILMQPGFIEQIPAKYHSKVRVVDVGPDSYGHPLNPGLVGFLKSVVAGWAAKEWTL